MLNRILTRVVPPLVCGAAGVLCAVTVLSSPGCEKQKPEVVPVREASRGLHQNYTPRLRMDNLYLTNAQTYESLKKGGFKPQKSNKAWKYSFPIAWGADPFKDANWQFQLHAWRMIDPILKRYASTGDPKLLAECVRYAVDWYQYHNRNRPARMSWYDMATGIRATKIGYLLDAAYAGKYKVSDKDLGIMEALAVDHAIQLQRPKKVSLSNHGLFQMVGLVYLCRVISNQDCCTNAAAFAERMYAKIFKRAFTSQGVHKEHSPYYHYFMYRLVSGMAQDAFPNKKRDCIIERVRQIGPWFTFPNGVIAPAGDSTGKSQPLVEVSQDEQGCLKDKRCFALGDFTQSGYAVIRSLPFRKIQNSMLFVTGMANSRTHKHADDLSFILYEFGRFVFIDSGKYGYNQNKWRRYVLSAAAHNTISLEDTAISPTMVVRNGSSLKLLENTGRSLRIYGEVTRPKLFTQKRMIEYIPGVSLSIEDHVTAGSRWNYVSSLHLAPDLAPEMLKDGFKVTVGNKGSIVAKLTNSHGCRIVQAKGQDKPILGWVSASYNKVKPTAVVRAICSGRNRSIGWDIQIKGRRSRR